MAGEDTPPDAKLGYSGVVRCLDTDDSAQVAEIKSVEPCSVVRVKASRPYSRVGRNTEIKILSFVFLGRRLFQTKRSFL